MGSITFDFLTDSFLFDGGLIEDGFSGMSDAEIAGELGRYRNFCLENAARLLEDAAANTSVLRVFAGLRNVKAEVLKQSALYIDQYVLPDPLFPFTEQATQSTEVMRSFFGVSTAGLKRKELCEELLYLKGLTPMVAADYVKFLPVSYLFEAPEQPPIYFSLNEFSELLPKELLGFLNENTITRSLHKVEGGWRIQEDLSLGRAIAMEFRNHDEPRVKIQHLFEQEVESLDEKTGHATFRTWLPETPPPREMFDHWVRQSVNKNANEFYGQLRTELELGQSLGASYFSTSPLVHELLSHFFPSHSGIADHTANTLLTINLPFLANIDTNSLMRVRQEDGEVFHNFRAELDKQFSELRLEADPDRLRVKAENILHDLATAQSASLGIKIKELRRGALGQAAVVSATFVGCMLAGVNPLVPAVIAAAAGVKFIADYRSQVRPNPAFFLWKVVHA